MKTLSRIPRLKISFKRLQTQDIWSLLLHSLGLTGGELCFLQIPLSGTELLLIVKARDSWRHPHQMDTGFHSMQKWNCTWLPRVGNNLLQKFVETRREVKSHSAIQQMQCTRHLPKAGDISPGTTGYCKKLVTSWNPGHWQQTLTNTSFSNQGWRFSAAKELTYLEGKTNQPNNPQQPQDCTTKAQVGYIWFASFVAIFCGVKTMQ